MAGNLRTYPDVRAGVRNVWSCELPIEAEQIAREVAQTFSAAVEESALRRGAMAN